MKHLSEFEVRSFRNVRQTTLKFRPGINVVLGKNAAGKTTLLKLLADSIRLFPAPQDELSTRHVLTDGTQTLRRETKATARKSFDRNRPLEFSTVDRFEAEFSEGNFSALVGDGVLEIDGKPQPMMAPGDFPLSRLVRELRSRSPELLMHFFSFQPDTRRLDESLDYLNELLAFSQTRKKGSPTESSMWLGLPASFQDFNIQNDSQVGPFFSAPFLDRVAAVMGYQHAQCRVDVDSKTTGGTVETRYYNLRFAFRAGQDSFTHASLSYGEKRLLAFFAMSDACPDIVIADELVNGLHHDWIRACIEEIGKRQAFLTSQNPLLLDYMEFESVSDVQHGFVLCERSVGRGELVWRNPTEDEAREFFSAYETGIQTVSEILIAKGFW
ncbi:MAG: AAA family ATPase [Myxococcaceae bacterium]|jgi:energy-coupling factor transporter ATP-binding protein EcfA2|nr:AAA family ATPase [Myxococcaceae bacterium]